MNNRYNYIPNAPIMHRPPINNGFYYQNPRINGFFGKQNPSKITFSSILNGTSKTLGVINQAIPIIYQIKPVWNNAKTMFKVVKGLNTNDKKNSYNTTPIKKTTTKKEQNNAPTFFA